jgi:hypothetical protein
MEEERKKKEKEIDPEMAKLHAEFLKMFIQGL